MKVKKIIRDIHNFLNEVAEKVRLDGYAHMFTISEIGTILSIVVGWKWALIVCAIILIMKEIFDLIDGGKWEDSARDIMWDILGMMIMSFNTLLIKLCI